MSTTKPQYFSHFGAVERAPDGSAAARWLAANDPTVPWLPGHERMAPHEIARDYWFSLWGSQDWEQHADGTRAAAWVYGDGSAVLSVQCPRGGWAEAGAVAWPLRFTAPAAVAGACCAPRYGLGESDA